MGPPNLSRIDHIYMPIVTKLGAKKCIKGEILNPKLWLFGDDRINVFYAPLGERLLPKDLAKISVLFVGLTPGLHQTKAAYHEHFTPNLEGNDAISFEGPMRSNLVRLMNGLGLPKALGISSTTDLFTAEHGHMAESTSLLRYPVFVKKGNYSGSPHPEKHPFLKRMILEIFEPVLRDTNRRTLIVPLGSKVAEQVQSVAEKLGENFLARCLIGFPHTSGANNGRIAEYLNGSMPAKHRRQIKKFFLNV